MNLYYSCRLSELGQPQVTKISSYITKFLIPRNVLLRPKPKDESRCFLIGVQFRLFFLVVFMANGVHNSKAQTIILPSAGLDPVSNSSSTPAAVVAPLEGAVRPQAIQLPTGVSGGQGAQGAIAPDTLPPDLNTLSSPGSNDPGLGGSNNPVVLIPTGDNKWRLKPIFKTGYLFDNNVFISNKNQVASSIYYVGGGLNYEVGDYRDLEKSYLIAHYIGTGAFYANTPQENGYCQDFGLSGKYKLTRSKIEWISSLISGNAPNSDVGGMVNGLNISNMLRFAYDYSDATTLDLIGNQSSSTLVQGQGTTVNNSPSNQANYLNTYLQSLGLGFLRHLNDKLQFGLQAIYGYDTTQSGPNQRFQILNGRFDYKITGMLSMAGSVGAEFIQFATGGEAPKTMPVFNLAMNYVPNENTTITLSAARSENNSQYLASQNYAATGFNLGLSHTMLTRWTPGITIGYANNSYYSVQPGVQSGRIDNIMTIKPSISYTFLKDFTATLLYQFKTDNSNQQFKSYNDTLVGLQITSIF